MNNYYTFRSRSPSFDFKTVFDMAPISEAQKTHMAKVYTTIAFTALVTFLTVAFNGPWAYIHPIVGALFVIASMLYIMVTKKNDEGFNLSRLVALLVFSVGLGVMDRNYIRMVFSIEPAIVNTALMASIGIFTCFTLAALFFSHRVYMYISGTLMSLMAYIVLTEFANLFFKSAFVRSTALSLGIFMFVGFVVVDTQVVLKKVEMGRKDYIMDAVDLYYDLFALFFKILCYSVDKHCRDDKQKSKTK